MNSYICESFSLQVGHIKLKSYICESFGLQVGHIELKSYICESFSLQVGHFKLKSYNCESFSVCAFDPTKGVDCFIVDSFDVVDAVDRIADIL